jgi:hypothetical protein
METVSAVGSSRAGGAAACNNMDLWSYIEKVNPLEQNSDYGSRTRLKLNMASLG